MYVCIWCVYERMHVCIHACMYVYATVCMYVYAYKDDICVRLCHPRAHARAYRENIHTYFIREIRRLGKTVSSTCARTCILREQSHAQVVEDQNDDTMDVEVFCDVLQDAQLDRCVCLYVHIDIIGQGICVYFCKAGHVCMHVCLYKHRRTGYVCLYSHSWTGVYVHMDTVDHTFDHFSPRQCISFVCVVHNTQVFTW